MLFGVAPSAKNSDFTARLRHLPSLFIYFFCAIYFPSGVHSSCAEETEVILEVHHFLIESRPSPDFMDGKSRSHLRLSWLCKGGRQAITRSLRARIDMQKYI